MREDAAQARSGWLTPNEAAAELKVSRDTIERLVASGQLQAAELNTDKGHGQRHRYRIHRDWLDEFMQHRAKRKASSPEPRRPRRAKRNVRYVAFIR
jgi:excisionase family DNA binding protein